MVERKATCWNMNATCARVATNLRAVVALVAAVSIFVSLTKPAFAEKNREAAAPTSQRAESLGEKPISVTRHTIEIAGQTLEYTARAGTVAAEVGLPKTRARIFFVAYTLDGADPESRAISYVFNGGPGAASAYLHLLALGPRTIALNDDGTIPDPPVRMVDNPLSWLAFTDLVFIDPVGTGYSQAVGSGGPDAGDDATKTRLWSVTRDLDAIAEFVRLHLTRMQRWHSPKFLVGESYGGFRAAALPKRLSSRPGVRLNGIVLISPVLEFSHQRFNAYRLLPWASVLPVYAATARYHGKIAPAREPRQILARVEAFAMGEYLSWLANVDAPDEKDIAGTVAKYLGLPRDLVVRYRGRVPRTVFAKALLRDSRRLLSLYDGTVTGIDPHPAAPILQADDPILAGLTAPLTSAFNEYIRERLKFETELPYLVLNPEVSRKWDWTSGTRARRGPVGTADHLKEAMSLDPALTVFIAHGDYDLVTPYLSTKFTVREMALDSAIRSNLVVQTYEGGHMLYTHAAARAAFFKDAQEFFRSAAAKSD